MTSWFVVAMARILYVGIYVLFGMLTTFLAVVFIGYPVVMVKKSWIKRKKKAEAM